MLRKFIKTNELSSERNEEIWIEQESLAWTDGCLLICSGRFLAARGM